MMSYSKREVLLLDGWSKAIRLTLTTDDARQKLDVPYFRIRNKCKAWAGMKMDSSAVFLFLPLAIYIYRIRCAA